MTETAYIQNREHWCWAVACKIVGEQYKRLHPEYDFNLINEEAPMCGQVTALEYEKGVVTDNLQGINWRLQKGREARIDAWQRAIVMNANTDSYIGYDGDISGDDEAKTRGIKYYLTGDIYSNRVTIECIGSYDSTRPLLDACENRIRESAARREYIIGNAVFGGEEYHSFVILCMEGDWVMLYDTANGERLYCRAEAVFAKGFQSSAGTGIIRWIQRIVPAWTVESEGRCN